MAARDDALNLVTQFEARSDSSIWIHIARSGVATDLRSRVGNPNLIDSSLVNLCGPAAFFRNLAIDDPVAYVRAGISLYELVPGGSGGGGRAASALSSISVPRVAGRGFIQNPSQRELLRQLGLLAPADPRP